MNLRRLSPLAVAALLLPASASASVLLTESFDYTDGDLLTVGAPNWATHSGTTPLNVNSGKAVIDQADATSGKQDNNRLLSQTFDPAVDNTTKIYGSFSVNFSALPTETTIGSYFAHLKSSAANEFYARIGANTEGAAAGSFRMAVTNEAWSAVATIEYPQDLVLNTEYLVVFRFDLATDQTTLWVNPTDESSTSVTATDVPVFAAGSIEAYALRQGTSGTPAGGPGTLTLDGLRVATTFAEAVPEPSTLLFSFLGLAGLLRRRR